MKITIVCAGKLREQYFQAAAAEYLKRLSRFADVAVAEARDEPVPERLSEADAARIMDAEAARMLQRVPERARVFALAADGRGFTSRGFSERLAALMGSGQPHAAFVIGGTLGLGRAVYERCDERVSLSSMTLPHQLCRVVLLEQLYRAFKIMRNEPYHH